MRKVLLSLLLIALLAIFAGMVITGMEVGKIPLGHSVQSVVKKNNELDSTIATLSTKIDTEYQAAKSSLDASFKNLQNEKQAYQEAIAYSTEEELMAANQTVEYKLDYVWTTIGLDATKHGVVLKADLSHGTSGVPNQFNISFTAIGEYLPISEFIYDIEKDASLGFRIEEFAMVPYSENGLQATFIIKNVAIDPKSLSSSASVSTGTVTNNANVNNSDISNNGSNVSNTGTNNSGNNSGSTATPPAQNPTTNNGGTVPVQGTATDNSQS